MYNVPIRFNHSGGTSLWVGTTKISGSSTSTGSFGNGDNNDKLEVTDNIYASFTNIVPTTGRRFEVQTDIL